MALFRRRGLAEEIVEAASDIDSEKAEKVAESDAVPSFRSAGPYDNSEVDLADSSLVRLDLGSLQIPGLAGIQVQVEADEQTQEIRAVTAVAAEAAVQLQPFAAPRTAGIWDELRAEMLAELSATPGAEVQEGHGAFGPELLALVPAHNGDGEQVLQRVRFAGIDGPRWFLRVVFLGRAAVEPDPEDALHLLVRQTIVVRGNEPMAPRDPLLLRLPEAPPDVEAAPGDSEPQVP